MGYPLGNQFGLLIEVTESIRWGESFIPLEKQPDSPFLNGVKYLDKTEAHQLAANLTCLAAEITRMAIALDKNMKEVVL